MDGRVIRAIRWVVYEAIIFKTELMPIIRVRPYKEYPNSVKDDIPNLLLNKPAPKIMDSLKSPSHITFWDKWVALIKKTLSTFKRTTLGK